MGALYGEQVAQTHDALAHDAKVKSEAPSHDDQIGGEAMSDAPYGDRDFHDRDLHGRSRCGEHGKGCHKDALYASYCNHQSFHIPHHDHIRGKQGGGI